MGAQRSLLGLGATALAAVSFAAKAKEGMEAKEKAQKNYELAVQQKQENINLTKARIAEVEARTANVEALNKAKIENTEAKTAAILGNTKNSQNIANAKVDAINAKASIDKANAKKINAETKQIKSKTALNAANTDLKTARTAQINAQVERMAKLAEEPAKEAPITAENSTTNIEVDEDVKKLQEVKANIEAHNIPETAKAEEPTEDRLDWHNYADKFYEGIGYEAADQKVKEKYGKTVGELYDENNPVKEKLEQLKSTIDFEKYRPTENDPTPNGGYYYQNVVWDRLYKDYPEYKDLEDQIGKNTQVANEAYKMRDDLARDSNSLTLQDFGFSEEEQDEWSKLEKSLTNTSSENYIRKNSKAYPEAKKRYDELEGKRVAAAFDRKNVINSYYKEKEAEQLQKDFETNTPKLYKVWAEKGKSSFDSVKGKKLPAKVQEAYDRINNKQLNLDWSDDIRTLNEYYGKQMKKKLDKENK